MFQKQRPVVQYDHRLHPISFERVSWETLTYEWIEYYE